MIKLLENSIEKYVHNIGVGQDFLNKTQKRLTVKEDTVKSFFANYSKFTIVRITINVKFPFTLKLGTLFIKRYCHKNEKRNST